MTVTARTYDTASGLDLIDESSNISFQIDTQDPYIPPPENRGGNPLPSPTTNDCIVLKASDSVSGIHYLWWTQNNSTATFEVGTATAAYPGSFCNVSSGTYTIYAEDYAGNISTRSVTVSAGSADTTIEASGAGWSDSDAFPFTQLETDPLIFTLYGGEVSWLCDRIQVETTPGGILPCTGQGYWYRKFLPPAQSIGYKFTNVFESTITNVVFWQEAQLRDIGYGTLIQITFDSTYHPLYSGESITGSVTVPEVWNATYTITASSLSASAPYNKMSAHDPLTAAQEAARLRQTLRLSCPEEYTVLASSGEAVFDSTMTLQFDYTDAAADTATLKIYRFVNSSWDSSVVTNQSVSKNGNQVQIIGASTRTGIFATFFNGVDTTAPVSTFTVQGSSLVFDGTLFVSTDAYIVLMATDPVAGGWNSQVATTYYRIDPSSSTDAWWVYSSSVPLPIGPHIFEYWSKDWKGNSEAVKTSTFVVTAGAALKVTGDYNVLGKLLAGYNDSGAKANIESRAENDYTLLISSPNLSPMLVTDNIGNTALGQWLAEARLDIAAGSNDVALQLDNGNASGSTTSVQIAMGYNGTDSMRHTIITQHGASAANNRMDFKIWNPGADAVSALASRSFLSVQSTATTEGAVHVCPTADPPDAHLEVSDWTTIGNGTIRRLEAWTPSSSKIKSDIKYLSDKEQAQAYQDVISLKHAKFRYKTQKPQSPLSLGLIYKDPPNSMQARNKTSYSKTAFIAKHELLCYAGLREIWKQ